MEIFKQNLMDQGTKTNFNSKVLEKVWRLLSILHRINEDPYLKSRLALKGGTALNLFLFDLPRLSVDIDLNYIGELSTEKMFLDRPRLEASLETLFQEERLSIQRIPNKHAGGKWRLRYPSVLGGFENLDVDLNFMFRLPIWELQEKSSCLVGDRQIHNVSVFNEYELAAGKLSAFFSRTTSRDLFDAHYLLTKIPLDLKKLRFTFFLYASMGSIDPRKLSIDDLSFDVAEIHTKLVPVMKLGNTSKSTDWKQIAEKMLAECKTKLSFLFPFDEHEKKFLEVLHDEGVIRSDLLTQDPVLAEKIRNLPLLKWRALLALKNKEVSR